MKKKKRKKKRAGTQRGERGQNEVKEERGKTLVIPRGKVLAGEGGEEKDHYQDRDTRNLMAPPSSTIKKIKKTPRHERSLESRKGRLHTPIIFATLRKQRVGGKIEKKEKKRDFML